MSTPWNRHRRKIRRQMSLLHPKSLHPRERCNRTARCRCICRIYAGSRLHTCGFDLGQENANFRY
jgi:hypothetical protein